MIVGLGRAEEELSQDKKRWELEMTNEDSPSSWDKNLGRRAMQLLI
jgi:hypothetical protein